jgi:putative peptide maturation system protein
MTVVHDDPTTGTREAPASRLPAVAARVTAFLEGAAAQRLPTDAMRPALADLQTVLREEHPALRLTLVAHVEPFDGSLAHDVVVRDGTDVLVIGTARGPSLPWPLRGVTKAGEQRLLRVNGQELEVTRALACLDVVFDDRSALLTLIHSCLVAEALEEDPIELTDGEVQAAADAFRRAKGLLTAEQTSDWRTRRAMSEVEFESLVRRTATVAALRRRVATPDHVRRHFTANHERYTTVLVAWAAGVPEGLTCDALAAVARARRAGLAAGVDEWRTGDLPPGMSAVASAALGVEVPVRMDDADARAVVIDRREAELDAVTSSRAEQELFTAWLDDRRRNADVEWHWGDALRTSKVQ